MAESRHITISEVDGVTVVRFVYARIADEPNVAQFGAELYALVEPDGSNRVLLNLSSVTFLSSSVLGKLITLNKKVAAAGGTLKLSNVDPTVLQIITLTHLDQVFDIEPDEEQAVQAFQNSQS